MGNLILWYPKQILLAMCLDKQVNMQPNNLQKNQIKAIRSPVENPPTKELLCNMLVKMEGFITEAVSTVPVTPR
jgi:hypothetical protein